MRLIIPRTCTCKVISHLYRDKLDVAEREGGGPGGEGPSGRSGGSGPPSGSRGGAPFGGFLCLSPRYNKVQLYCRSAGRQRALFLPISDKSILYLSHIFYNEFFLLHAHLHFKLLSSVEDSTASLCACYNY